MSDSPPASRADEAVRRLVRADFRGTAVMVVAAVVFAVLAGSGWSWPYFVWGVGGGVLMVVATIGSSTLAVRLLPASAEERARAKRKSRERWRGLYLSTVVFGAAVGVFAGSAQSAWPDVALTVLAVLSQIPALFILPRLRRRARTRAGG